MRWFFAPIGGESPSFAVLSFWAFVLLLGVTGPATAQRPSTDRHVTELASCLDHVQIAEPIRHGPLSVYPILLDNRWEIRGRWLDLERALSRGVLSVTEKGAGGSVPQVVVENRSRDEHVLLMTGEVLAGGKQTRTVRHDVVLAPGERVELDVFCVEAHRWEGGAGFSSSKLLAPQSIQRELRRGADQNRVWSEVARNNAALGAENRTGSLALALESPAVKEKLGDVRRSIEPRVPTGTMGYVFVSRGRAFGLELFGNSDLARRLLPKLLDSYAVDFVVLYPGEVFRPEPPGHRVAIEFFERVCRVGSNRHATPGSGAGIRTRTGGLLGDGVSLGGELVHYGIQVDDHRPIPVPNPPIIYPPQR